MQDKITLNDITGLNKKMKFLRPRTIAYSAMVVAMLIFYFLVKIVTKNAISWIDLIFLSVIQIFTHIVYYPDGELSGSSDIKYIANNQRYNDIATRVNKEKKMIALREYCEYEYQERKKKYIENELGIIGITEDEFKIFKKMTEKEINELTTYEIKESKDKSYLIVFTKAKRKHLYNLLFKELPIEKNKPETIMSGLDSLNGTKAIHDTSISNKKMNLIFKVVWALAVGCFFAYVGFTLNDGVAIENIARIFMYLWTLLTTGITSFASGERNIKVNKNNFYLSLSTFLDEFFEWNEKKENAK